MSGLEYRLQEFIRPAQASRLIVDTSAGLVLGALSGLEDYEASLRPILPLVDGVVCSPGHLRWLTRRTHQDAGLLVRVDWNNTLRNEDFVIPLTSTQRIPILSAQEALDLGAVGMVSTFLLGHEEQVEADCLRSTVKWALDGKAIGIPLVVEILTNGPRVSLPEKAIELGASYALEGGADVIVIPYPGHQSLKTIAEFVSVPWLVKVTDLTKVPAQLDDLLNLGGAGLWLDQRIFALPDPAYQLKVWSRLAEGIVGVK